MPGLDLSQVSSNWKKLQAQLKSEPKPPAAQGNGLKRKRLDSRTEGISGAKLERSVVKEEFKRKRAKVSDWGKRRKMGSGESKPSNGHTTLIKDHDIPSQDVTAAYGSTQGGVRRSSDVVNGGIHPTHKAGKYVALDCEMVGTGPPPHTDNVLARASLVNFHGEQIYDSYVLPPPGIKVEDYRTHVSGIKPAHLKSGARPFADVQKSVGDLLQDRLLVGHALSNDLRVLLLSHPKRDVRDTSRYPKFRLESMGKPPALRNLAKSELGLKIQTGEHSSIEDARAAMMLFKKEKVGFEEENRKTFGRNRRVEAKPDDEVDEAKEEDEDLDLIDGEEEGLEDDEGTQPAVGQAKKNRKKKKRTKR